MKKETDFEFSVVSDPEYEDLVADIGFENQLVAAYSRRRFQKFTYQNLPSKRFRLLGI